MVAGLSTPVSGFRKTEKEQCENIRRSLEYFSLNYVRVAGEELGERLVWVF